MKWSIFRMTRGGGWGGINKPIISLTAARIAFNEKAAKDCIGNNERVVLFADEAESLIGFCFINGECDGSGKVGRKEGRPGATVSAKQFFATYPKLLVAAAQLQQKRYDLNPLAEADVPEEFAGSDCFFVKIER